MTARKKGPPPPPPGRLSASTTDRSKVTGFGYEKAELILREALRAKPDMTYKEAQAYLRKVNPSGGGLTGLVFRRTKEHLRQQLKKRTLATLTTNESIVAALGVCHPRMTVRQVDTWLKERTGVGMDDSLIQEIQSDPELKMSVEAAKAIIASVPEPQPSFFNAA